MIKLIIVDDHKLIRDGLKAMLAEAVEAIQVVGEAASGNELMAMLAESDAGVVLMDIQMPDMDGLQATQHLKEHFPHIKVLVLSMIEQEKSVEEAMKAGALGYLLKTTDQEELLHAIQAVARGESYISTQIALKLLNNLKNALPSGKTSSPSPDTATTLSKREIEVLGLIAQGYTNGQIGDMTFTSKRTVETHRQSLLEKTGSTNTAMLIVYALKHHLIDGGKASSAGS